MGYRTIIVLNNDEANVWGNNPLGKAITVASGKKISNRGGEILLNGVQIGNVIDCEHSDTESIVHFSSLHGTTLGRSFYNSRMTEEEQREAMIVELAESMGYKLVKNNPEVKNNEVGLKLPQFLRFEILDQDKIDAADEIIISALLHFFNITGLDNTLRTRNLEFIIGSMKIHEKQQLIYIIEEQIELSIGGHHLSPKSLEGFGYKQMVEALVNVLQE